MIWLIKRGTGDISPVSLSSAIHTEELNGESSLSIVTTTPMDKYDSVIFKNSVGKWFEYIVESVDQNRETLKVYLEHSVYELHHHIIRDIRPENRSVSYILGQVLANTRWTAGTSDISGLFSMSFYFLSSYECIKKLITEAGGEIQLDIQVSNNQVVSRTINIVSRTGADRGRIFSYSKDLLGVEKRLHKPVITALIGRGKGEELEDGGWGRRLDLKEVNYPDSPLTFDYVFNEEARLAFGLYSNGAALHRFDVAIFDEVEDPEELYTLTKKQLDILRVPQVSYEVPVILLDSPEDQVSLGDTVYILDNDFLGDIFKLEGRILKIRYNMLAPEESDIVIGNVIEDLSSNQKKVESILDNFRSRASIWDRSNAFNSDNELPASYISELLKEWNNKANHSGGFVYITDGEGFMTYDQPITANPQRVVQIVGGTIRIANSKDINGEWVWRTVINYEGIAGEQIIANSITANKLSSDFSNSLDLSSNTSINLKIEDIKIGGRNLVNNSTFNQGLWTSNNSTLLEPELDKPNSKITRVNSINSGSGVNTPLYNAQRRLFSCKAGQEVVISFDYWCDSESVMPSSNGVFTLRHSDVSSGGTIKSLFNNFRPEGQYNSYRVWKRLSFVRTIATDLNDVWLMFGLYMANTKASGGVVDFKIREVQFELGNKASSWGLSFEDIDNRVTENESEIQLTKDFFSLTFTKNLHEMKNKLVYGNTVHMYGAEVAIFSGFEIIETRVPFLWTRTKFQGTSIYNFMPTNVYSLYNMKLGVPYTFSCEALVGVTPSGLNEGSIGFEVFYYTSVGGAPILLQSGAWFGLGEFISGSLTFTLPTNSVGWLLRMKGIYLHTNVNEYMYVDLQNVQLEEGSVKTAFSNNASTISGARYVFNGDNASFYNGGLQIFNKDNLQVFGADTQGDLWTQALRIYGNFRTDATVNLVRNTGKSISTINATASDENIWNSLNNTSLKLANHNNSLAILVGGTTNDRNAIIQVGHNSELLGQHLGNLNLNPFGGDVTVNGNMLWHRGNFNPSNYSLVTHTHRLESNSILNDTPPIDIPDGITNMRNSNTGYPIQYGVLFNAKGLSSDYVLQIYGTRTGGNRLYFRNAVGNTTWQNWAQIWHSQNFNPSDYSLATHTHSQYLPNNVNSWITDEQGSQRLWFGASTNTTNQIIFRASNASGTFQVRRSNNSISFEVDFATGQLLQGDVPRARISGTAEHRAGNGFATSSSRYDGSIERIWTIGGGTGITVNADDVALTSITSGVNTVGALRYNGTSRLNATLYGGSTVPSGTTNLNYDGIFWAQGLRFGSSGSSSYSDKRMKKDVGSLNYADDLILTLKPKQFKYKSEYEAPEEVVPSKINAKVKTSRTANRDKLQYGLIAQDVEKTLKDMGIENSAIIKEPNQDSEFYGIDYTQLIAPMIATIQRLEKRISELEKTKGE